MGRPDLNQGIVHPTSTVRTVRSLTTNNLAPHYSNISASSRNLRYNNHLSTATRRLHSYANISNRHRTDHASANTAAHFFTTVFAHSTVLILATRSDLAIKRNPLQSSSWCEISLFNGQSERAND